MDVTIRIDECQITGDVPFLSVSIFKGGCLVAQIPWEDTRATDQQFAPYCRLDAYIWHDYTSSIVTVGSFESPNDPALKKYVDLFGPQVVELDSGKKSKEFRFLPVPQQEGGYNYIPFEANMRVMAVPRAGKK